MLKKDRKNTEADIEKLVKEAESTDSKSELYVQIAKKYRQLENFQEANNFLKKAKENSETNFLLAENYYSREDFPKAEEFYEKVTAKDNAFTGNAYYGLGTLNLRRQALDEARAFFKKAIEWNKAQEKHFDIGKNYNLLASVFASIGQHKLALEYFEEALEWNDKTKNYVYLGKTFHNLDIFLNEAMTQGNRLVYYERLLENESQAIQAFANQAIGIWHQSLPNFAKAKSFFEEALKLKKSSNISFGLGKLYYYLGSIYEYDSDHQKAIEYHVLALRQMLTARDLEQVGVVAYFLETAIADCKNESIKQEADALLEEVKALGFTFGTSEDEQSLDGIQADLENLGNSSFGENLREVRDLENQNTSVEHLKNSYQYLKENLPENTQAYLEVARVLLDRLEEKYRKAFLYKNKKRKMWEDFKIEIQEQLSLILKNESLDEGIKGNIQTFEASLQSPK